jgi:hypothetical protein
MALVNPGLDQWPHELRLDRIGRSRVTVVGWTDAVRRGWTSSRSV